ncbi:hypothetical protein [Sporisorium scitamineum]|uniref:Uncharacterized protein n=1 Tax=Sporisorium scitamineum TaxID=49012 RepID=A0A0F7RWW9_9BASI|nr:hypothetical protein [Sporisorium scitamineum]
MAAALALDGPNNAATSFLAFAFDDDTKTIVAATSSLVLQSKFLRMHCNKIN